MSIELTPEEEAKQFRDLTSLRYRHHELLVQSGVARRVLDAKIPVNYFQNDDEFTEGTILYPSRKRLGDVAVGILWGAKESIVGSCQDSREEMDRLLKTRCNNGNADLVLLGRIDALPRGHRQAVISAGIQIERGNLDAGVIAPDGVQVSDVIMLTKLLEEVQAEQQSGRLSCLDPNSLVNHTIGSYGPVPIP